MKKKWKRLGGRRVRAALIVSLLTLLCTAGVDLAGWRQTPPPVETPLEASGVIHVNEIAVASELGGRITSLSVEEGDAVEADAPLVQLDTALIDTEIASAEALVAMAEAGLAQAQAGVRPTQLAVAEAQLRQAQAGMQAAQQAVTDTARLLTHPQELDLQIAVAEAQLTSAEHQIEQAAAQKDAAHFAKGAAAAAVERYGDGGQERVKVGEGNLDDLEDQLPPELDDVFPPLPDPEGALDGEYQVGDWELHVDNGSYTLFKWIDINVPTAAHLAPHYYWQAWVGVNAASAQREGIARTLADLRAQRAAPQDLQAQHDTAQGMRAQAEAQIRLAEAQLEGYRAGATAEEVAVREAQVRQARAGLEALQEKREMMTLTAPQAGVVLDLVAHPGEVIAKGTRVLTLAELDEVILVVYVPEPRLGQIFLGQPVRVTVDSFPDRTFEGRVRYIADEAEFTPRNVATKEERVHLVFAVEIGIPNDQGALKPGMPADVVFERVQEVGQ
jgi:multidrug efflux pump subunit AcrA (membrane-fusion protein)